MSDYTKTANGVTGTCRCQWSCDNTSNKTFSLCIEQMNYTLVMNWLNNQLKLKLEATASNSVAFSDIHEKIYFIIKTEILTQVSSYNVIHNTFFFKPLGKCIDISHSGCTPAIIVCDIIYTQYTSIMKTQNDSISNLFDTLLESKNDFIIKTSCNRELKVHKFILAAQSPVFRAIFENDMKEKRDNSMTIKNISYDALREVLRFMYYGKLENLENIADEVFDAADMYQVKNLREACMEYFCENINIINAIKILKLYQKVNYPILKNFILKFIQLNKKEIIETEEFKALNDTDNLKFILDGLFV